MSACGNSSPHGAHTFKEAGYTDELGRSIPIACPGVAAPPPPPPPKKDK